MCVGHTHMLGCPSPAYTGGLPAGTVTTQDILATEHQVTLLYVRLMMQSVPHRQSVVSHIVWVMFHMVWVISHTVSHLAWMVSHMVWGSC